MSTIFTRTSYDQANLELKDVTVKNTNDYVMNLISAENANLCYSNSGAINGISSLARPENSEGFLDFEKKADVESKLQNRHLPLGSFDRTNRDYQQVNLSTPRSCAKVQEHLVMEDSRLSHPVSNYRGMYTAEYNFIPYLHMNPQDVMVKNSFFHGPDRIGAATRMQSKEAPKKQNGDFKQLFSGLLPKRS